MQNLEDHLGNLAGGLSRSLRHNYKRVKVLVQPTVNVAKKIKTKKNKGKFIVKILSKYFYISYFAFIFRSAEENHSFKNKKTNIILVCLLSILKHFNFQLQQTLMLGKNKQKTKKKRVIIPMTKNSQAQLSIFLNILTLHCH